MATTIVRPNADSSVAFTPLGGGTNHSEVSESSPDDDTSYNTSSLGDESDIDMFTFANASIPSGDVITSVILTCRARDTGGGQAQLFLRTNHDALYESTAQNLGTSYANLTDDVTADETWLPADFDGQGVTIGYRVGGNSTARERRVTQVFLTIIHAAPADIFQEAFRWRDDDGDEAGATFLQAQNVNHTIGTGDLDANIRLRFGMANTGGTAETDLWQLEAQINGSGGFTDVDDVSTNGARSSASANVGEGDATTAQLTGLSGSFVAGGIDETDGSESFTVGAAEHTEEEFVFQPRSAELSGGDFIDFRLRIVAGTTVTYTNTPRLTISAAAGPAAGLRTLGLTGAGI